MGRHGGGSRSGGSHRSSSSRRSSSGSRSHSSKTSQTPFRGCYNRSYYDKRGKLHCYYTNDKDFGTKSGWNFSLVFALIFITLHMSIVLVANFSNAVEFGNKINGNSKRIFIEDTIDILTQTEEEHILSLLQAVYNKSGMPITIYTDNFEWKNHYDSLEIYSEELYYSIGMDEDSLIILFTTENINGFQDWEYDVYCGDNTITCFSDTTFDKFLDNFQKSMANQNLAYALDYAWNSVMDDLATTKFHTAELIILIPILFFYGVFYFAILGPIKRTNDSYKYFQEHPEQLSNLAMTVLNDCPHCGASNSTHSENCTYCGSSLKL